MEVLHVERNVEEERDAVYRDNEALRVRLRLLEGKAV